MPDTWPVTLPQRFDDIGYRETLGSSIVSRRVAGPPLRRRRFTAPARTITARLSLTNAQSDVLSGFYLDHKNDAFEMTDAWGATQLYRFLKPPVFAVTGSHQRASLSLLQVTAVEPVTPVNSLLISGADALLVNNAGDKLIHAPII